MIKIFIVDDQQLIIDAWTSLIRNYDDMQVVHSCQTASAALDMVLVYRPDIILLDINLQEGSGIELCGEICNKLPKAKVIGLSFHNNIAYVEQLISKGAMGYLTKNTSKEELIECIRQVDAGNRYICKEMQDKYVEQMMFSDKKELASKELTPKEIEVLKLIATGMTSKEIAEKTFVSPRTVETHRYKILKKLGLPNTAKLVSWAVENGYVRN